MVVDVVVVCVVGRYQNIHVGDNQYFFICQVLTHQALVPRQSPPSINAYQLLLLPLPPATAVIMVETTAANIF